MVRPSPKTRTVCAEKDNSEATASNAYLDEYVSSLRGASAAVRDEALQREIGTLASLIQSTGQGHRSGSSGAGSTTPVRSTNATPVEEAATSRATPVPAPVVAAGPTASTPSRYRSTSATAAAAAGVAQGNNQAANQQQQQPPPPRTQQQRQSELFVAQRFARYFMGRLLERIGGRQASLNSLDAAQLNIFNFYRRAVAEKLRDLAEDRIEYHTFRRVLRELYQRATDGAVPDLWGEFVRFCTAQRQGPVGSMAPTSAKAGTPPPGPKRSSSEVVSGTPTSSGRSVEGPTGTTRGYSAASSIASTGMPKPGSSSAQRTFAAKGPNQMQYLQSSSDQKNIALAPEAKGDQASAETPKDKAYSTAAAREVRTLDDRPPHLGQQDRQPGEHAKQRNDTEDDDYPHHDDDEDDDIERLVKVDLERERALLELENVLTTVVDAAPETFLLDKAALMARFLGTLQKHGNLRAAKSCLALLSFAAENRLRQVLERTLQWSATRRHVFPRYALSLAPPCFSVRTWMVEERKKLAEERARKRYALSLPDEDEQAESGTQAQRRKRAAEHARQREKVQEANVALSGMLAALTAARRKRPAPSKTRSASADDLPTDTSSVAGAEMNPMALTESGSIPSMSIGGTQMASSMVFSSDESATRNVSGPTILLRDVIRALEMDPLARKSRHLERWASRIQRTLPSL